MTDYAITSDFARASVRLRTTMGMTAMIQVLRGTLGTLDPDTGLVGGLQDSQTVYRGLARIRTVGQPAPVSIGGGEIAMRDTIISIPMTAPKVPHRDDLVRVLSDTPADTDLNTRIFRVLGADGGGMFGDARRISCSGWYQSRYWNNS